jgi:pseudoazurin
MKYIQIYLAIFIAMFTYGVAFADDISLDMLNKRADGEKMVYSQDIVKVDIGDTVTWLPKSKGHNVEFIGIPEGMKKIKKSKLSKEYSYTFEKAGIYLYQCTPHKAMGMIGVVIVGNDLSNLDKIKKVRVLGKSKKKFKKLLGEF